MLKKIKAGAKQLKHRLTALFYAQQSPSTPWYCRILIYITLLYALSPIDLIPDFIPVLGLLDDLLLLPLAIYFTIKLLPDRVWQESLLKAEANPIRLPKKKTGLILFALFWVSILYLLWHFWISTPEA